MQLIDLEVIHQRRSLIIINYDCKTKVYYLQIAPMKQIVF